ncbi:MAG: hypothetical protein J6R04_02735, partial [Clostridia bacterium]|nr:hypothetical protein [Clostridia bacterium]
MKRILSLLLACFLAVLPLLALVGCQTPIEPSQPDTPSEPDEPEAPSTPEEPEEPDLSHLPSVPSDREITVEKGTALHENTEELGRIPQGLVEVVNKYMTSYEAMNLEGAITTFQTNSEYAETQALPTEAVMAYCGNMESVERIVKSWGKVDDKYELHMMTIINRTNALHGYMSADPSRMDQAMKDRNGNYILHSGTTHYLMPNEEWTEYVWEMVELALDTADLKTIVFEEPDIWKASGYSECFKREWQKYYGEPWVDQTSSPEAMYKSQQLKVHLLTTMMETLITRIKEKSPETKVYMATHSAPSYNVVNSTYITSGVAGIVTGTNQYLATGLFDGIIGQTWSDTSGARLTQDGKEFVNRFLGGYLGYASYVDSVGDLDLFTLADPVGDGVGKNGRTEQDYHPMYFDTIVAQMMQPLINRYQVVVWPARSFEAATQDYRAVQLSVMAAQTEASGKQALQSAGTPGISYVMSDTVSYALLNNSSWAPSSNDSMLGVTLPLLTDGIPLTITAMENIKSPEDLEGINLLLLTFDGQKPMEESVCEAIAAWIEQGGVCLYVGGHDAYDKMENAWWSSSNTPLQALFNILGLDITVKDATLSGDTNLDWLGKGKQVAIEALTCTNAYNNFYSAFEGDVNAILDLGGHIVGIDEEIGDGHLIAVSLPAALFAETNGGTEAMRKLAEYACKYTEYEYDATSLMWSKRGNVVAAYSIDQKNVLTGKYLNLFDTQLGIHTHYVLEPNTPALLYDITDFAVTDAPRVAFSGGVLTVNEESPSVTKYNVVSPANATVASRIMAPKGLYPQKITACNYKGNIVVETFSAWDSETGSLLVRFLGMVRGVNVTVEWGTTPVADYELQRPAGIENFIEPLTQDDQNKLLQSGKTALTAITNEKVTNSLDWEFIIENTSKANADTYFCDNDRKIVWCIDLQKYPGAYMTLSISQNYLLEVSTDGESWETIQNFITVNGNRITAGSNAATFGIDSKVYAKDADKMYVRLSNADPKQGHGGAITQYQIFYDAPAVPETDPADYAPIASDLNALDELYTTRYKRNVVCNAAKSDLGFIHLDRAKVNNSCRYCDTTDELYLKIDLTKFKNAVVALRIAQNYRVLVSADDRIYVTARDYILAGNEWISNASNSTYLIIDSAVYAKDSDALYIKLDNAGPNDKGYGAALYGFTLYYEGESQDGDPLAAPAVSVKEYAPLVDTLDELDAKYADRQKFSVVTNSEGKDVAFIHGGNALANARSRYCDSGREITYKFDLNTFEDAVVAVEISQNYRVLISADGTTFTTVQDWVLAGNEWGEITLANKTYVVIDTALYLNGVDTLYIKIDNAGTDKQGWGGAIYSLTIYYYGEEFVDDTPSTEELTKGFLPVHTEDGALRSELEAKYAKAQTIIVNTEYPNSDAEFVVPGMDTDKINHLCKFCDGPRSLTYQYDLTKYMDAVVLMMISNNYTMSVSTDAETW